MGRIGVVLVAAATLLCATTPLHAEDGALDTLEDYLDSSSSWLDENRLFGTFRFSPFFAQRFIYDDNIFMNDEDEPDTRGRVADFISDTNLRLEFVMPVNKEMTKLFKRDRVTLLSYEASYKYYFRESDVSNFNQYIRTDLFSMLKDILNVGFGNRVTVEAGADYSYVTDPIDILVRDLTLPGFPSGDEFSQLNRHRFQADAGVRYLGNEFDVGGYYDFEMYRFDDAFFEQADHRSHRFALDVGVNPSFIPDKRVFLIAAYTDYSFDKGFLNDAEVQDYRLGIDGSILTKKLDLYLDAGYLNWEHQDTGLLADDSDYSGGVGLLRLAFQPWLDRKTKLQMELGRDVTWSAIANYRQEDKILFQILDEIVPRKLDGDITASYGNYQPSDGPKRRLLEVGVGLFYHLYRQMDLTLRYLYRQQWGYDENTLTSLDPDTGEPITIETNGDFYQHVISLGLELKF